MSTENIPGMCDFTNHMRDLVTAENEWVLSHGIELFLTEIGSAIPFYLRDPRTTQAKIGLSAFAE